MQGAAEIVSRYGFEPERLKLQWIGASEGPEFQEHMTHFAETIRALGPSKVHNVAIL
jgi:F420-non-reducing hydrogenase iron-sulfur subunit